MQDPVTRENNVFTIVSSIVAVVFLHLYVLLAASAVFSMA